MNRRQFLKTAVGAMTAPYFIPAAVLGKNGAVAPSNRITVGCIGVGGMGTANLNSFLTKPNAQVLAVCDVDLKHRHAARDLVNKAYDNQDCATYNDFRELLAREDIDAVMIAVPDQWHGIIGVAAAQARKDIYGEKPLAYTIAEGRAIVEAVQRHGVIWQTGSWQRSQQHFRFGCELVRNGRIGQVHTVRVGLPHGNSIDNRGTQPCPPPEGFDYDMWLGPAPWRPYNPSRCHWNFRWISDYSGGQLTDWAGHHCDIANWAMNTEHSAPIEIEGQAIFPPAADGLFDTPESYYFECKYAEGFTMIVADRQQQPKGMGAHFLGTEGWVYVDRSGLDAHPQSLLKSVIGPNEIHLYESNDHVGNFLDCVASRAQTITPAAAAHHAIMIGHLGNIAMQLGRKVRWNPSAERFINDPAADRLLSRPMRSPWHL
ncbi:MAG: Inositol 2-dehydrogenase/D-chiro-inositol 3-dehydrogenase [bacterium]|nr:Inositol 2-dehydrogenase/D-chiro-inositol 3-dehydrogenase [bacterium]